MKKNQKSGMNAGLGILLAGVFAFLAFAGCDSDDPLPPAGDTYYLTLEWSNETPEVFLDSTSWIKGDLKDAFNNLMDNQRIELSVVPDSLGNITPPNYTYTDTSDINGFREQVGFTGRITGHAKIIGRYYRDDLLKAETELPIEVKQRGNE